MQQFPFDRKQSIMCTVMKLIILLTVLLNVKCKQEEKMVNIMEAFTVSTKTHTISVPIEQQLYDFLEKTAIVKLPRNIRNDINITVRTWEPADTADTSTNVTVTPTNTHDGINSTTYIDMTTPRIVGLKKACPKFTPSLIPFNLEKMADIWQTVYYQLEDKIQCFKIHIKRVTDEERYIYNERLGNFNGKVNWSEVFLEIKALTKNERKHFLQGGIEKGGVMKNIIVTEDKYIQEESGDQWLAHQKLLIMRDCETGGIVVFAKVPHVPLHQDIADTLKLFGALYGEGKHACVDEDAVNRYYEPEDVAVDNF